MDGRMRRVLLAAAQMVDDLDGQRRRENQSFQDGFRSGFDAGYEVGYGRGVTEAAEEWARLAQVIRQHANRPTHDELSRRRAAPGPNWRQYEGGPVQWDGPARPPMEASA